MADLYNDLYGSKQSNNLFEDLYGKEKKPESGGVAAFKSAIESIKGDAALTAGKLGIMGLEEAEAYKKAQTAKQQQIFAPTQDSWGTSPLTKASELFGGSVPYLAAPIIGAGVGAGVGALAAPAAAAGTAVAAGSGILGALGLTTAGGVGALAANALQYTGSNLGAQMEDGRKLADTNLLTAGATAVVQGALDNFSLKSFPIVQKIFGKEGIKISDDVAKEIVKKGTLATAGEYVSIGAKVAGKEGTTEVGQEFLQRLQAGQSLTDEKAREAYYENFIGGAVLGGAFGVVGHKFDKMLPKKAGETTGEQVEEKPQPKPSQMLMLPPPEQQFFDDKKYDPLQNPLGNFLTGELTPEQIAYIDKDRQDNNKPKLSSYSLEDFVDALRHSSDTDEAKQGALDNMLTYKTGYDGTVNATVDTVLETAKNKNIETGTQGFLDFLTRTTGTDNLEVMSPVQLYAAFNALRQIPTSEKLQILPEGTNATRFSEKQYDTALKNLKEVYSYYDTDALGQTSVIKEIMDFTGLTDVTDAKALLRHAINKGDLEENFSTHKVDGQNKKVVNISFAGKVQPLPTGFDIRHQQFNQGTEPEFYEVKNGSVIIDRLNTKEEADASAAKHVEINKNLSKPLVEKIAKLNKAIQNMKSALDVHKAKGFFGTPVHDALAADIGARIRKAESQIAQHENDLKNLSNPLKVVPSGKKVKIGKKHVFYDENGKATASFHEKEHAEQYGLMRKLADGSYAISDAMLQQIIDTAPKTKGTLPKRYAAMAKKELERRNGTAPKGIQVKTNRTNNEIIELMRAKLLPELKKLGLEKVGLRIVDSIANGTADGSYVKQIIQIAIDAKNQLGTLRHEAIHALRELGAFTPQEWKILENKAKSEWIDKFIKGRSTGKQSLYEAYQEAFKQANNGSLKGFDEYIQEEAIAEAFKFYAHNKPPAGLVGNLFYRLKNLFEAIKNMFKQLGFTTADEIFTALDAGKRAPIAKEVAQSNAQPLYAIRPDLTTKEGIIEDAIQKLGVAIDKHLPSYDRGFGEAQPRSYSALERIQDNIEARLKNVGVQERGLSGKWHDSELREIFDKQIVPKARQRAKEIEEERRKKYEPTKYSLARYDAEGNRIQQTESNNKEIDDGEKASPEEVKKTDEYYKENGIKPYLSEGQLSVPINEKFSLKAPYKEESGNDPITGLPLNKNGTVTLYYPTTIDNARRINNEKTLVADDKTQSRIYLTNESSGWKTIGKMGQMPQKTDGSVARVEIDPSMLQVEEEYEDGRKDFFVPIREGEYFNKKLRLWAIYAERAKAIPLATKYTELGRNFDKGIADYELLDTKQKRIRLKEIRKLLKQEHNVGTLLSENGKLEKTKTGDYGLTYDDQSVASLGLGLASAQKLNDKVSTCPVSAICEGLCLGDTSGNNMMYGGMATGEIAEKLQTGKTSFRSGARLSQYLKTEAMIVHPQEFITLLHQEITNFEKWAKKNDYKPAIRLNVTSDIPPKYYKALIDAHPDVMFYDYTKLDSKSVAPNHHLTYSSTGASQIVNGEKVENKHQNWKRMRERLDSGDNVAMAFTSKTNMPSKVIDEETNKEYKVWDGDNYDARFLDPKQEDGIGMIIGLTNKAATLRAPSAAKETDGFFIDYDKTRDGDTVTIRNQNKLIEKPEETSTARKVIPIAQEKFSIRAPETPAFKQWFGDSKVVNPDGSPKVMYHGTARDIHEFRAKQAKAIFLTPNPDFAESFAEASKDWILHNEAPDYWNNLSPLERYKYEKRAIAKAFIDGRINNTMATSLRKSLSKDFGQPWFSLISVMHDYIGEEIASKLSAHQNIMPVFVRAEKPFDYEKYDKNGLIVLFNDHPLFAKEPKLDNYLITAIKNGAWVSIESPIVQDRIKALGFDSFYVKEGIEKNLAVYDPTQIKSATGNYGNYDIKNPDIRYSIRDLGIDPKIQSRINANTFKRVEKGFVERLMDAISPDSLAKIRQAFLNKYEGIERLSKEIGRQFGSDQLLADTSAIAAALQSDRASGIAASAFRDGVPVFDKGYTYVSNLEGKVKGLIPVLEPLMKYNNPEIFQAFQYYGATRRGKRLLADGREQLFTQDDIKYGNELEKQFPEFKGVFEEYQKFNQGLVKYMKDTGVISDVEATLWTQNWDYIPFYRQLDGETTAGPRVFSALSGVAKPKKLKGGEEQLADFLETVVRNSRAAIESGMKNEAARRVVRDAVRIGLAEEVPLGTSGSDIVTVKENGLTKHYRVADPLLVESMKGLNLPQMEFLSWLSAPANLLRNLVTKDPGFMIANLGRDSLQAWITSGTNMVPIVDTFKQFAKALTNQSPEAAALARAGLTGYDFAGDVASTAKMVEKELRKRGGNRTLKEKALLPLTAFWDALEQGSHASDMATRAEVYKKTLERTGNEAEAFYQAMEVLNFSRKGNNSVIRILTAVVPFFNARIQGLDVLYRSGWGKMATENAEIQKKAFAVRSLTMMGLSMAYWYMVSDDDEYKRLNKEERDNNWIVPAVQINGKPFKFPIPFELGVVFKVLPERVLETAFGNDTGKDLKEALVRNMLSTLQFNPIPQAFVPIVENVANYSFFTGEPIVGQGMQDVAARHQTNQGTSSFAKTLGESIDQSPIKIDNLIRGYTGTMGTYAVQLLNSIFDTQGESVRASKRLEQLPVVKRFFASDSGTISAYYSIKEDVDTVVRTINVLEKGGDPTALKEYIEENKGLYGIKNYVSAIDKNMKKLREYKMYVNNSKTMDADEKRERLDVIHEMEINMTSKIKDLRKQMIQ